MLETFRKHHYVLMCLVAVVVIISFTFFFNPNTQQGQAGSGAVVRTLFDADLTQGDMELIEQQKTVIGQVAGGEESARTFFETMHSIVDESAPLDRRMADADYSINIFLMRQECERLGIAVEKEDVEKRIRQLQAFQTNGQFDGTRLDEFLTRGQHGDRSATETKLFSAVRDVMLFERLGELIGGTYAPSAPEIDADFARAHESVTVATALFSKKDHENQTVTDEEIQKFYDEEKAKQDDDDKTTAPDPIILTDEKRTVKYCVTEAPKFFAAPPAPPQQVPALPAKPDFAGLSEEEKKAREEEWKKQEENHRIQQEAYTKASEEYSKLMAEYQLKQKENETAKQVWLRQVSELSNALVADPAERAGATFEQLAKPLEPPPAAAPVPATAITPPVPLPAPSAPEAAPEAAPAPAPGATPAPAPENPAAPAPAETPADEQPKAVQGAQGPAGTEGQPSAAPAPAEPAPALPAETPAPAGETPVPAAVADPATPAETAPPASDAPAPPAAAPAPLPFVRSATFTKADPPADIKAFNADGGATADIMFQAEKGDVESLIPSQDKNSYLFFQVTDVVPAGVRPLEEVKQKITDKLMADKIAGALQTAADDARSKILEDMKAGKSFKEAAEANKAVTVELPSFSVKTPLATTTANAAIITAAAGIASEGGPPPSPDSITQPGEISQPLKVADGLLLVYVQKKELQKFPDAADQKNQLRQKRTYHAVMASVRQPQYGPGMDIQTYMKQLDEFREHGLYFERFGGPVNPVFKAWFTARRNEAQTASP